MNENHPKRRAMFQLRTQSGRYFDMELSSDGNLIKAVSGRAKRISPMFQLRTQSGRYFNMELSPDGNLVSRLDRSETDKYK